MSPVNIRTQEDVDSTSGGADINVFTVNVLKQMALKNGEGGTVQTRLDEYFQELNTQREAFQKVCLRCYDANKPVVLVLDDEVQDDQLRQNPQLTVAAFLPDRLQKKNVPIKIARSDEAFSSLLGTLDGFVLIVR